MKKLLLGTFLALLGGLQIQAGNILVTNYNEDTMAQLPISLSTGAPLLKGGTVQIGTWISDPGVLIAGLTSPAGREALLASFMTFGEPNAIGNDVDGLYQSDKSVPIAANSPLVGQSIYTVIGNAASLSTSDQFAIIKHNTTFAADAPVFAGVADISLVGSSVILGCLGGRSITTALGAAPSLSFPYLEGCIPEPMSLSLLFASLALMVRRRRMNTFE
jgi:hypothetical protein